MFVPLFRISHKILTNLIGIEVNHKMVQWADLTPDWETKLKSEALTRRVYSALRFGGNMLEVGGISKIVLDEPGRDDKASEVALRTGVVGKEKDVQQVLNWLNANNLVGQIAYLSSKFKQSDYGEKDLIQINVLLGEKLVEVERLGRYRDSEIADMSTIEMPGAVEVPYQMDDLFLWFKSTKGSEVHPILKAGVMLRELVRIHPFADNNLHSSLEFFILILAIEGYSQRQLIAIEEELFKNKDTFYKVLTESAKEDGLTVWLEYVTGGIFDASEKTKVKVMNLVGGAPVFKSEAGKVISLSERQIVIMEEMTMKNEMTIKEIRGLLPMVSDDTILRDLKSLMDKKLIRKKGRTKGATYLLGKVRNFR